MADNDRYGRILRRVWFDEVFQSWSSPPPCAQFLWLYLCTTPRAGSIPGVFTLSLEETAKRLGWPLDDTRRVFAEIASCGRVEHDERTDLLFIPSAIRHDSPRNPNVVKSWKRQWAEVPPGPMRDRISSTFAAHLAELGAGFVDAWAVVTGSAKQPGNNSGTLRETIPESVPSIPRNSFEVVSERDDSGESPSLSIPRNYSGTFRETPSETESESVSVSDLSGGSGGQSPAPASRRLSPGAKLVRAELERGRQLYPASEVPDFELDAMAERMAFDIDDPVNRAAGEHSIVARDAVRSAREHKTRYPLATPTNVFQRVETASGWLLDQYRSGKRKRAGGVDGVGALDDEHETSEMKRTLRDADRDSEVDAERKRNAISPTLLRDHLPKLAPRPPFAS